MKLILRTLILFIPAVIMIFIGLIVFIGVIVRNLFDCIFNQESYWTGANEWHQIKEDFERWYKLWRHGFNPGDH